MNSPNQAQRPVNQIGAAITVGCGVNAQDASTLTYKITSEGVTALRCDGAGRCIGGFHLDPSTLDVLCQMGWTSRDEATTARAKLFPEMEAALSPDDVLADDVDQLRSAALASLERIPGMTLAKFAPALLRVLAALEERTRQASDAAK